MDKKVDNTSEGKAIDEEFEGELDKVATERGKLRRKLSDQNPEMAKLFEEQTPEQKAWGRCVGKLIVARSNDQVEDAFKWFEMEALEGKTLPNAERAMGFFHAIASIGCDDAHYRILRRMYVRAITND